MIVLLAQGVAELHLEPPVSGAGLAWWVLPALGCVTAAVVAAVWFVWRRAQGRRENPAEGAEAWLVRKSGLNARESEALQRLSEASGVPAVALLVSTAALARALSEHAAALPAKDVEAMARRLGLQPAEGAGAAPVGRRLLGRR